MTDRIDGSPVQVVFSLPAGQWDAVCVLAARAGMSPAVWVEGAVTDCVAAGLDALPERYRFAGAGCDADAQGGGYGLGV